MRRIASQDQILKDFLEYLSSVGISFKSIKFYKSDFSHFTSWLLFKIKSYGMDLENLSECLPFLNKDLASQYKDFLTSNKTPTKTVNRRLSTLRHLARFFLETNILDFDFMDNLKNVSLSNNIKSPNQTLIVEFQRHLEGQSVSKNTIKNYLSDIRQFLFWLEQKEL